MAPAEAASPSVARRWPLFRIGNRHSGISGHALLLARPAYRRLLSAEPFLRRSIPVLIVIFLVVVGLARFVELYQLKEERELDARAAIGMTASVVAAALADFAPAALGRDVLNTLADAMPPATTGGGRRVYVTDADGAVVATAPRSVEDEGLALTAIIGESQPLTTFGARAGVLEIALANGERALAAVHHLDPPLGAVAVVEPLAGVYADWRASVSLNVAIFVGTSAILLVILYGYFAQSTRAIEADRIYSETQARFETALARGRCGLWDWDLAHARVYWSRSMFEIVGLEEAGEPLLAFGDVSRLVHPDDIDLMEMVESLFESGETTIDRIFRMRHADGHWIWMRARTELVDRGAPEPHLIGIAVDVTEQMRLVERSKTADIRLRDAIETIPEAFVLWDAENRLVLCNSNFQQLHKLSDEAIGAGTSFEDIVAAGRRPVVHTRLTGEDESEDGARTFEALLDDGRWLHISERRTKDGGFVSVGTDITALKLHEERLMSSERRLMATIADLRNSQQALKHQTRQLAELAEKYSTEKNRAEDANQAKSKFLANMSHELRTPLNAILGFSEIMESGMFGPLGADRYIEYCRDIRESGQYLLDVISDVLDMSKIEAGRIRLDAEEIDLDGLLAESMRIVSQRADDKGLTLTAKIAPEIRLCGDRRSMKQIALNLLSNAVKFTPEGGRVTVRARAAQGIVTIAIADNGIGIAKEALERLGRPFEQVDAQFTKRHEGSGLGLAIAKSLIQLHGGSMHIRSTLDKGTTVLVRLPVSAIFRASSDTHPAASPTPPRKPRGRDDRQQALPGI